MRDRGGVFGRRLRVNPVYTVCRVQNIIQLLLLPIIILVLAPTLSERTKVRETLYESINILFFNRAKTHAGSDHQSCPVCQ